jgi:hypothetical protein
MAMMAAASTGSYLALRMRARTAFILLAGIVVALAAETGVRLVTGSFPRGFEAHVATLGSAYGAIGFWQLRVAISRRTANA